MLIPIAAVVVAITAQPSNVGKTICIPSGFFTGVIVFFGVVTGPARVQRHELAALAVNSVVAGIYMLVCAALWFARPKLKEAVVAAPNASRHAGSAGALPPSLI